MHPSLVDVLVDPVDHTPLKLTDIETDSDGNIGKGNLISEDKNIYPIINGIPRFLTSQDGDQKQTEASFGYKWEQTYSFDSPEVLKSHQQWLVEKYGFGNLDEMRNFFGEQKYFLDAGCGAGLSAATWLNSSWQKSAESNWYGVDISSAIDVAQQKLGSFPGTHFVQADVMKLPFAKGSFDIIFSEGVLHHTPSTEAALKELAQYLRVGGEILFYVYRAKGPIREFTDDYIREIVSPLAPEEAWDLLKPLTKLGEALANLNTEVYVPEDIPFLGIKAGHHDVQRLIYWNFAKLFWNPEWKFEHNHHVNFDWYHPRYAHRHTEADVRKWCHEAKLEIFHFDTQESGFTVRATKV